MRVLMIEDDEALVKVVDKTLKKADIFTYFTGSGEEGIDLATRYDYDLVLLDLKLPDLDGYTVLKRLRENKVETPVLILTGINQIDEKIRGFELGADDFITKPFNGDELRARISAIVRRSQGHSHNALSVGDLTIDIEGKVAVANGHKLKLTKKDFQLLEMLARKMGLVVSKDMLRQELYVADDDPDHNTIDVFIFRLRKKLAAAQSSTPIQTIRGQGYVLAEPDRPSKAAEPEA